jgi:hypothetical protein
MPKVDVLEPLSANERFASERYERMEEAAVRLITHGRMQGDGTLTLSARQMEQLGHDIMWLLLRNEKR